MGLRGLFKKKEEAVFPAILGAPAKGSVVAMEKFLMLYFLLVFWELAVV